MNEVSRIFPEAAGEFLEHYSRDARLRWSPEDLAAQAQFVHRQTQNIQWLDWSRESEAFRLMQAKLLSTADGFGGSNEAILVAGPVVELLGQSELFVRAVRCLHPRGRLVGIIPCLRDNSPESQLFARLAATTMWPYHTAEELLETIREAGFNPFQEISRFVPVSRFNEAVLKDQLGFKGFRRIFEQLEAEGYDPMEVGWGELRFAAALEETEMNR